MGDIGTTRVTRHLLGALDGLGLASVVAVTCYVFEASFHQFTVGVLTFAVIGFLTSGSMIVIGLSLVLSVFPVLLFTLGLLGIHFTIPADQLLTGILVGSFVLAGTMKWQKRFSLPGTIPIPLVSSLIVVIPMISEIRGWSSEGAFGVLVSNGEDNATWLLSLANSFKNGHLVLTDQSGLGGGISTGMIAVTGKALFATLSPEYFMNNADNGLVLLRLYFLLCLLTTLVWAVIVDAVLPSKRHLLKFLASSCVTLLLSSFVFGLAKSGHFSAVCAVFFLSVAVLFAVLADKLLGVWRWIFILCVPVSFLTGSQAWFPLLVLLLGGSCVALVALMSSIVRSDRLRGVSRTAMSSAVVLVVVLGAWVVSRIPYFRSYMSIRFLRLSLSLPGGYTTLSGWFVVFVLLGQILLWNQFRRADLKVCRLVVASLLASVVFIVCAALFFPPYSLMYGPLKLTYVVVSILSPVLVILIVTSLSRFSQATTVALFCSLIAAMGVAPQPLSYLRWPAEISRAVEGNQYTFVPVIVRELRERPERSVTCQNSYRGDTYWNYITYLCSRMAHGLGGFNDESSRVWTAMQICGAPIEQALVVLDKEFSKRATVILSDSTRLTTRAGCQMSQPNAPYGWLSSISWDDVRVLDVDGSLLRLTWNTSDHDDSAEVEQQVSVPLFWGAK